MPNVRQQCARARQSSLRLKNPLRGRAPDPITPRDELTPNQTFMLSIEHLHSAKQALDPITPLSCSNSGATLNWLLAVACTYAMCNISQIHLTRHGLYNLLIMYYLSTSYIFLVRLCACCRRLWISPYSSSILQALQSKITKASEQFNPQQKTHFISDRKIMEDISIKVTPGQHAARLPLRRQWQFFLLNVPHITCGIPEWKKIRNKVDGTFWIVQPQEHCTTFVRPPHWGCTKYSKEEIKIVWIVSHPDCGECHFIKDVIYFPIRHRKFPHIRVFSGFRKCLKVGMSEYAIVTN